MLPLRMLGLLMLMFVLCDADSTCPTEINPLSLDPPEVIGKFGDSVSVNCSTTEVDHDGMYWTNGNITSATEYENSVAWLVPLSDWNVKAECIIQLGDSGECSQDQKITIYKNPEDVILFPTSTVVEGTPCELQCDILNVAPVENLTVTWYKNNETIMTESFSDKNKTLVDKSSTLIVNISRGDDGAQFKCEAQLDFGPDGPKPPVVDATYRVSVQYAPKLKNNSEIYEVFEYEGNDVILSIEADGNPSPTFTWTCDGMNVLEKTKTLNISRIITNTICNCTVSNSLGSITKQIRVHVIKAEVMNTPEVATETDCALTLMPAEVVVRYGDPVSINCSTSATDTFGIGWEASSGGTGLLNLTSATWKVDELKQWGIAPQCYLNLKGFQCIETPVITLYKLPDSVLVSVPDPAQKREGTEYTLTCAIINVAPVEKLKVKWYRGDEVVHTETFNGTSLIPDTVASTLTVTAKREHNGVLFRCEAELHLGPKGPEPIPTRSSSSYTAAVLYVPRIHACPDHFSAVENYFRLEMLPCQADGNPPPTVLWYYEAKPISKTELLNRTHAGEYYAVAGNTFGYSNIAINITFEYGPSFHCDHSYEVHGDSILPAACEPMGIPKPDISWYKDGKMIATPQRWTKHDTGTYLLSASNQHGSDNHTLYLEVLYPPVFSRGNYTEEVTPGENVIFGCSAEGNPAPVVQWEYAPAENVMATTGGSQRNITVTGATSTNAGVYICVATNKVGSATRSVTLVMKGKTSAVPSWLIWLLLILLSIVIVLICIAVYRNRFKKRRKYSFVSDKGSNDLGIPMTANSNSVQT